MPFPNIDPVALQLGPLLIRWYALAYIAGIFFGLYYMAALSNNPHLWEKQQKRPSPDAIWDFMLWAMLGIIIGGRLGAVLFYYPDYYWTYPHKILFLWEGGMAFHGGLAGVILALFLYARRYDFPFRTLADLAAAGTPFGLFLGRIANFINGELWGKPTAMPWGVVFPHADSLARHPSQLYEAALEGILLFVVLRLATHRALLLKRPGIVAAIFMAGYGAARIISELFREPDIALFQAGSFIFSMGMALSLPLFAVALILLYAPPPNPRA